MISKLGAAFEDIFATTIDYTCFGFGDEQTKDFSFFPIVATGDEFSSYQQILNAYASMLLSNVEFRRFSVRSVIKRK
jgi:hypothetical protein